MAAFKKNLIELTELEIKHAKVRIVFLFNEFLFNELYVSITIFYECIYFMFTVARRIAQEMFICTARRVIYFSGCHGQTYMHAYCVQITVYLTL